MGPDGCLSNTGDNAGLLEAASVINTVLEPIWQKHCDVMSRADFWALFAKLVVEKADPTGSMHIDYQYGRVDSATCSAGAGRLPNAQLGHNMLQQVFVTQMGLTLDDTGNQQTN
jgi:catalase (peroxidase I)